MQAAFPLNLLPPCLLLRGSPSEHVLQAALKNLMGYLPFNSLIGGRWTSLRMVV